MCFSFTPIIIYHVADKCAYTVEISLQNVTEARAERPKDARSSDIDPPFGCTDTKSNELRRIPIERKEIVQQIDGHSSDTMAAVLASAVD